MTRPASALAVFLLVTRAVLAGEADWPSFRGGERAGSAEAKSLPDAWSPEQNVVWKCDIPGRGWSSPIVWGERVLVTSVMTDGKLAEARKGLYIQDLSGKVQPGEHRYLVHCLDFKTGKTLWTREAHKGAPANPIHIKNTYASETPVVEDGRIYVYFGNVGLFCYDLDGQLLWSTKTPVVKMRMGWGSGASPVAHEGRLYVVNDNEERSTLTAYDGKTGKQVWQVERDEKSNWATPFIWKNETRTEIVTAGTNKIRSYDLDGKLLWEMGGMSIISIPTPFARHALLYVSSGYVMDLFNRPVYAIRPGAKGDITLPADAKSSKDVAWAQRLAGPYHPTPLVHGDYLYVLYDRGMLSCFEAKTGKLVYEQQRLGAGATAFTASPWAYNGKVFCLSEDGDTIVVQAGPEFKILGRNKLDEMSLATPAIAHGSLIVRTQNQLFRLEAKGTR
jgi:outer membrane protein assembly factor BamB